MNEKNYMIQAQMHSQMGSLLVWHMDGVEMALLCSLTYSVPKTLPYVES